MISSFLLQDIPTHPDTRLFEVREAFKRSLLLGFQVHIRAYIAIFSPPAAGVLRCLASPVALSATDAETLINALVRTHATVVSSNTMKTGLRSNETTKK